MTGGHDDHIVVRRQGGQLLQRAGVGAAPHLRRAGQQFLLCGKGPLVPHHHPEIRQRQNLGQRPAHVSRAEEVHGPRPVQRLHIQRRAALCQHAPPPQQRLHCFRPNVRQEAQAVLTVEDAHAPAVVRLDSRHQPRRVRPLQQLRNRPEDGQGPVRLKKLEVYPYVPAADHAGIRRLPGGEMVGREV